MQFFLSNEHVKHRNDNKNAMVAADNMLKSKVYVHTVNSCVRT